MELNKRIEDNLNDMLHNLDRLLENSTTLSDKQQYIVMALKRLITSILALYIHGIRDSEFEMASRIYRYDLRPVFGSMASYLYLLEEPDNSEVLTDTQLQLIERLKTTRQRIMDTFTAWIEANQETDKNA